LSYIEQLGDPCSLWCLVYHISKDKVVFLPENLLRVLVIVVPVYLYKTWGCSILRQTLVSQQETQDGSTIPLASLPDGEAPPGYEPQWVESYEMVSMPTPGPITDDLRNSHKGESTTFISHQRNSTGYNAIHNSLIENSSRNLTAHAPCIQMQRLRIAKGQRTPVDFQV